MGNRNVLNFEDGIEELALNGDNNRIIRFNPTSATLLHSIEKTNDEVTNYIKELDANKELDAEKKFDMMDSFVKSKIDEIFGAGSSEIIFGSDYAITTVKGNYVYENFLISVMNYMTVRMKEETELSRKRVEEYTKKAEELKK